MCTSKEYFDAAYVVMGSVMHNNPEYEVSFYVSVCDDVDDVESMRQFVESKGNKFNFIKLEPDFFNKFKTQHKWTKAVFIKLLMHTYLPQDIERILYLDMDTICCGSLEGIYECDFEDNYIASCANSTNPKTIEQYNNMSDKDKVIAADGGYFNSGVILFNLNKIRRDINVEMIEEAYENCLKYCSRYLADQSILNWMYCEKTKYLNPLDYNYRIALSKNAEGESNYKKAIIHFVSQNQPYKPWDLLLTDKEVEQIRKMPFEAPYIYISEHTNYLVSLWWKYAENTPVYSKLYREMLVKKAWFMVYGITTVNNISKYIDNNKKIYRACGYIEENRKEIARCQNQNNISFLKALYMIRGIEYEENDLQLNNMTFKDAFEYFDYLKNQKSMALVIVGYHTVVGNWEMFLDKQCLGLTNLVKHCESYCAFVDFDDDISQEQSGKGAKEINCTLNKKVDVSISQSNVEFCMKFPSAVNNIIVSIRSRGYDSKKNYAYSNILVNNVDYSMNKRGLNFAVIDKEKGMVVDAFNVDTHGDETFSIVRNI